MKQLCYDPRDKTWKMTDNPALLLASFGAFNLVDWERVARLANYCDQPVMEDRCQGSGSR